MHHANHTKYRFLIYTFLLKQSCLLEL